ncbi:MAG TPA: AMP-binding protein [Candidatus Nitrosotenuis sp.]|jgi:acyl-CoA synthetase (AMP-forming)/AMP-acid ligase II|nr:AMP-binding protein [Candidatus Nitrosotenuis sp.]
MPYSRNRLLTQLIKERQGIAFYFWDPQSREYLSISYEELYSKAQELAEDLINAGMSQQTVLVTFPQGLEFVQVVLACLMAQVTFVPLLQVRTKSDFSILDSIAQSSITHWVLSPVSLGERATFRNHIGPFFLEGLPGYGVPPCPPHEVCFLQYSSGTTHKPKGVMITHDNLLACLEKMTNTMKITEEDHGCIWLPPYQDLGVIGGVFLPLYAGFPLTLMSPRTFILNPLKWVEVMTEQQVTITAAPNFAYDLCVDRLKPNHPYHFDLSQLRVALNGAERVKTKTIDRFTEAFKPYRFNPESFYPAYGLTEATLMVSAPAPLEGIRRIKVPSYVSSDIIACGKPMTDIMVKIINDGREAHICEPGEIWISGPTVAHGYWNDPQATEKKFNQYLPDSPFDNTSYTQTGDLGFLDQDGYLYVLGRLEDQIWLDGKNYLSEFLEDVVLSSFHQGAIYKTVAFSLAGKELMILCEVTSRSDDRFYPLMDQAAFALHQNFDINKVTIALVKRGEIPVTTNGKLKRHAAQVLFQYGVIDVLIQKVYEFDGQVANPTSVQQNSWHHKRA